MVVAPAGAGWSSGDLLAEVDDLLEAVAGGPTAEVGDHVVEALERRLPGARCGVGALDHFGRIRFEVAALDRAGELAVNEAAIADPAGLGADLLCIVHPVTDARCAELAGVLVEHRTGAVWVQPVHATGGSVAGAVLVLHPGERCPDGDEAALARRCARLLSLAFERADLQARLEHRSLYDELTGLPNRVLLGRRIARAAERRRNHVALLFADLDQFRVVNDSLGHAAGDELLAAFGGRFGTVVRPDDTVGRFGGDEFVVLCDGVGGEAEAVAIADRLLEALAAPIDAGRVRLNLSASIGIALLGADDDAEALVRNAEVAMHRAKELGRGQRVVFRAAMGTVADERLEMERALHQAIEADEFHVLYQPQVRLADGLTTGVETLVRWNRPGHGPVGPAQFVPVAEAAGLVVRLGRWVMEHAVADAAGWPATSGGVPFTVTVNLSAQHLADPELEPLVIDVLARHGLDPGRLCLEVTESDLVYDLDGSAALLRRLKQLGVRLSIDDFGTGYATLAYVRRFSMADVLKIDATFVQGIASKHEDRAIVSAAIALGRTLGFEVIAEGVEDEAQRRILVDLGCDKAQGYLFSEAVGAAEVAARVGAADDR